MNRTFPLNILYEDSSILVCIKPAGLPVQTTGAGQKDLVSELKNYRARKGEDPYVGLIHRLDQPVHGIILFAKAKKPPQNCPGRSAPDRSGRNIWR